MPPQADPALLAPVERWLGLLAKALTDEVALTPDPDTGTLRVRECAPAQRGSYRWLTATDPEASFRVHGTGPDVLGYNVSLSANAHYIREIRADPGAQPDPVAIPLLLAAQEQHHDLIPHKLIYDSAAGAGKTFALVTALSDGQTQLVAPPIAYEQRAARFGPSAFTLSADGSTLTCPNGQSTRKAYRAGAGDGRQFRFSAQQCRDCPLWDNCRAPAFPQGRAERLRQRLPRLPPASGRLQPERGLPPRHAPAPHD